MDDRIAQLEALLLADPYDADLPFLLGRELMKAGRHAEAAARLERAAGMNPRLAAIRRFWGEALRASGDAELAWRVWEEGIALSAETGDLQAGKEIRALLRQTERESDARS